MTVKVIGAGLAGCEAAWQTANAGLQVELHINIKALRSLSVQIH